MFVEPSTLQSLDENAFEILTRNEAVVTHSTDLNKLVQDLVGKVKEYEELGDEEKAQKTEWAQALHCIVFNV